MNNIPGYPLPKALLAITGLAALAAAFYLVWPDLRILCVGKPADGVIVRVWRERSTGEFEEYRNEEQLRAGIAATGKDWHWVFQSEVRYFDASGKAHLLRVPAGKQFKPSYNLAEEDRLPVHVRVVYDPAQPDLAIMHFCFRTWFPAFVIGFVSIFAVFIGFFLWFYANKPYPPGNP